MTSYSLLDYFFRSVKKHGSRDALRFDFKSQTHYKSYSWDEWAKYVRLTACGLYRRRIKQGDRVGILSGNCPEWTFVDLGTLSLGAVVVPIYPTSGSEDIAYIVKDAHIKVLFVEDVEAYHRIKSLLNECDCLEEIYVFKANTNDEVPKFIEDILDVGYLEELNNPQLYDQFSDSLHAEMLATLIYTSGTTGNPKGVMLTHGNFIENCEGCTSHIQISDNDISISFLPLSHVFERMAGYYYMIKSGATICYASSIQNVSEDIVMIQPTVAAAVPRFYEKIYAALCQKIEQSSRLVQSIFEWAKVIGAQIAEKKIFKKPISIWEKLQYKVADLLIYSKLRKKLGGRIRFFISGGAPLNADLGKFFYSAGVLILEGYGLTETSPVIAVNKTSDYKFGTVGKILSNVKVKIAEDGEILTAGPCLMKGYFNAPERTAKVLIDGWFHTGDIGEIDNEGFLKITDRKKDIIVTSGGKNIAPQKIENRLLRNPFVTQVLVIGDKRNYLVALLVPCREKIAQIAAQLGIENGDYGKLLQDEKIYQKVSESLNDSLKDFPSYEQIKYFAMLENEFTQDSGELTPTLKVKRRVVMERYQSIIDSLYDKGKNYT